ncbi:MAG: hypothetical protein NTY35_10955 [Planctomycetota bacterium]|nr:hypothetical protein [Planctomycetota bacterium]
MNGFATRFDAAACGLGAVVACAALFVLVRHARRVGLSDDGSDAPERKAQRSAVPLAGGPALALAAIALALWPHFGSTEHLVPSIPGDPWHFERGALVLAGALAFLTGLVDDVRAAGLGPRAKLAGQTAAGVALALGLQVDGSEPGGIAPAGVVLAAVAAQNIANTFDHADGTLGALAGAAFAAAASSFTGALAVFLGFNLGRRRAGGPPYAFLGDSGSHLLGLLLATSSLGLAALTLPAVDLARVVVLRLRAGEPVWHGDRRHLGQRLGAAGRGPLSVVLWVLACAAPAFLVLAIESGRGRPPGLGSFLVGAAGSAALLALCLRLHPEPAAGAR